MLLALRSLFDAATGIKINWTRVIAGSAVGGVYVSAGAWGYKSSLAGGDLKLRLVGGALQLTPGTSTGKQVSLSAGQLTA